LRRPRYSHAVGITYAESDRVAPAVHVKGEACEADELVKIAKRFGVPVVENRSLASALSAIEIDREIPPSLFEAVAIVLAHLRRQTGRSGCF
jgi:flagellar biosynthesis protein